MKFSMFDKLKKLIKLTIAYPSFFRIFLLLNKNIENRAILIGSPVHNNLGDHLIAIQALRYISSLGYKYIIEIPEFAYELLYKRIKIRKNDTIFISGGGWMGNLYEDESVIESVLCQYQRNRIIILPQTIYYEKSPNMLSEISSLKNSVRTAEDLLVCVRDVYSYDFVKRELVGLSKCLLLPDMGMLALDSIKEKDNVERHRIGISLRTDKETSSTICSESFYEYFRNKGYIIEQISSIEKRRVVRIKNRQELVNKKIDEFGRYDLIITDRLHSIIFALLSGTKCIGIDNKTHKIRGVYEAWFKNSESLMIIAPDQELKGKEIYTEYKRLKKPVNVDFWIKMNELTKRFGDI